MTTPNLTSDHFFGHFKLYSKTRTEYYVTGDVVWVISGFTGAMGVSHLDKIIIFNIQEDGYLYNSVWRMNQTGTSQYSNITLLLHK